MPHDCPQSIQSTNMTVDFIYNDYFFVGNVNYVNPFYNKMITWSFKLEGFSQYMNNNEKVLVLR